MPSRQPTKKQKTADPAQVTSAVANYQSLANGEQGPFVAAGSFTGQPVPQYGPRMASTQAGATTTNPPAGNNGYFASIAPTTGGVQATTRSTQNRPGFNFRMQNAEQGDVAYDHGLGCGPSYRFLPPVPVSQTYVDAYGIGMPMPDRGMADIPTDDASVGYTPPDTAMANLHLNDTNPDQNDEWGAGQETRPTSGRKNHSTAGNKPGTGSGTGGSTGKAPKNNQDNAQHKVTKRVESSTSEKTPSSIFSFNSGMKSNNNNTLDHANNNIMKHEIVNVEPHQGQDSAAAGAETRDANTWELAIAPYIAAGNHLEAVIQLVKRVDDNHGREIFNMISTDEAPWARLVNHYYRFPSDHQPVNPQNHAFILLTAPCHGLDENKARRLFGKLGVDDGVWPRILHWWQEKGLGLLPKEHRMQKLALGSSSSSEREHSEDDDSYGFSIDQNKLNKRKNESVTNHGRSDEKSSAAPPKKYKPNTSIFTLKSLVSRSSSAATAPISTVQDTANSVNYSIANPGTSAIDMDTAMHDVEGPTTMREGTEASVDVSTPAIDTGGAASGAAQQYERKNTFKLLRGKDDEIIRKFVNDSKTVQDPASGLGAINLRELILDSEVWNSLSPEQRAELQCFAPENSEIRKVDPNQGDLSMLRNNDDFRSSVTRYQDDLKNGLHDSEWVAEAKTANQQRASGEYASSLAESFERTWGGKMPDSLPLMRATYLKSVEKKDQLEEGMTRLLSVPSADLHPQEESFPSADDKSSPCDVSANTNVNDTGPADASSTSVPTVDNVSGNSNANDTAPVCASSAGNTSDTTLPAGGSSSETSASMHSNKTEEKLMNIEYDIYE